MRSRERRWKFGESEVMLKKILLTTIAIATAPTAYAQCYGGVCSASSQGPAGYYAYPGFKNTALPAPPVVEKIPAYPAEEQPPGAFLEWAQFVPRLNEILQSGKSDEEKKKEIAALSFHTLPGHTADCVDFFNDKVAVFFTPDENRLVAETNRFRRQNRLLPLKIDFTLSLCARKHSNDMYTRRYFSHYSPERTTPYSRSYALGKPCTGENIAESSEATISGWEAFECYRFSPEHRAEMLGFHRLIGVGIVGNKSTQMFGY